MPQLRFEAWTLPTSDTFEKIRDLDNVLKGTTGVRELSGWTNERIVVPASWPHIDDLISDTSGCLIAAYMGDTLVDEMKATRVIKPAKRPSQRQLTGPQINGIVQELGIYPWRYPNDKPRFQDWIWGGDNVIGDLTLGDLGNIEETWELYLSGERYVLDKNSTSAGTFTLTVDGQTTDPIDWDASSADIESALSALSSVEEVTVRWDPDDNDHQIVFDNPKNLPTDMTADFSGLTGSATLTKGNDGFDPTSDPTFTITVDGETTEALAWDASTNTIEGTSVGAGSGLQGLSTVNDVRVTGSGVFSDPWIIVFVSPPSPGSVGVNFAAGTAIRRRTEVGTPDPTPITISKPVDQGAGSEEEYGSYENPAIQVITDPAHQDGDTSWVLRVNALSRFGGCQLTPTVTPGGFYQSTIRVKPTVSGTYTLVFRRMDGGHIKNTSPRDVHLTAGTYQALEVPDLDIPDTENRVIMRVAVTDANPDNIGPFYVNWEDAELTEGMPKATATQILRELIEAGQDRGAFEFLDLDFTDALDSAGESLDEISFAAWFGQNLGHVLDNLHDQGYEWRIVRKDTITTTTHKLQVWKDGPEDLTSSSGAPSVLVGGAVQDAEVVKRIPPFTALLAHGSEALYLEDTDATALGNMGRIERIVDAEHLADEASLQQFLDAQFANEAFNREAAVATVRGDADSIPLLDYTEGNTIWWQFPGILDKQARRVRRVAWVHDDTPLFTVQGSKVFKPDAGMAKAVDFLLKQFHRRSRRAADGGLGRDRALGQVTGAHIHLYRLSSLPLSSGSATVVPWESPTKIDVQNFVVSSFPANAVRIQEPGYYNLEPMLELGAAVSDASVHVTRTRGGSEVTVWPPSADPGAWSVDYSTKRFTGVAHAIPCLSGDEIRVYVTQSSGSTVNLTGATLALYLVDRIVQQTGLHLTGYRVEFDTSENRLVARRLVGGEFETLTTVSKAHTDSTWYWMRARIDGQRIRAKTWSGSEGSEPSGWDLDVEDELSLTPDVGLGGLAQFSLGTANVTRLCDVIEVTNDGGSAVRTDFSDHSAGALAGQGWITLAQDTLTHSVVDGTGSTGDAWVNVTPSDHVAGHHFVGWSDAAVGGTQEVLARLSAFDGSVGVLLRGNIE